MGRLRPTRVRSPHPLPRLRPCRSQILCVQLAWLWPRRPRRLITVSRWAIWHASAFLKGIDIHISISIHSDCGARACGEAKCCEPVAEADTVPDPPPLVGDVHLRCHVYTWYTSSSTVPDPPPSVGIFNGSIGFLSPRCPYSAWRV
jgi:hypothetical protein